MKIIKIGNDNALANKLKGIKAKDNDIVKSFAKSTKKVADTVQPLKEKTTGTAKVKEEEKKEEQTDKTL